MNILEIFLAIFYMYVYKQLYLSLYNIFSLNIVMSISPMFTKLSETI